MTYSQPLPPDDNSVLQPPSLNDSGETAQRESPLRLLSPLNAVKSAYGVLREIREIGDIYSGSDEYNLINRQYRSPLDISTFFYDAQKPASTAVIYISAVRLKHHGALEYFDLPLHEVMNYVAKMLSESDEYPAPTPRGWRIGANSQRPALADEQALNNFAPIFYNGMNFMRELMNCFPEKYQHLPNRGADIDKSNIINIIDYLYDRHIKRLSILRDDVDEVDSND